MATQQGYCTNFGNCTKADTRESIPTPLGGSERCPECGLALRIVTRSDSSGTAGLIAGAIVALLIITALVVVMMARRSTAPIKTSDTTVRTEGGNAGKPTADSSQIRPDDVLMWYERSDEKWVGKAAADFNKNQQTARIVLDYRGSREGFRDILDGKGQPIIWNPADSYWVEKLNIEARKTRPSDMLTNTRVILRTKLVFVLPKDRAEVLRNAMRSDTFRGRTWMLLSTIATSGWSALGGDPSWGKLKLAQSDPSKSNSSMAALGLMYNEWRFRHAGALTSDRGFIEFARSIEQAAPEGFVETTSKALDAFLKRRDLYDLAICYETNAIKELKSGNSNIAVVYPDPTIDVNFPAAVLAESWVTPSRKETSSRFVDYLLTRDVQMDAIQYGFRPVSIRRESDEALQQPELSSAGIKSDPNTRNLNLTVATLDDLVFQWTKQIGPH